MSELMRDPFAEAKKLGLTCVLPQGRELFIDIDTIEDRKHFEEMLPILDEQNFPLEICKETKSVHGNTHIYARVAFDIDDTLRLAFQAALGSDRKRELLGLLRVIIKRDYPKTPEAELIPSVFFEVPNDPS